jgi:hypothetical protein
MSTMSHSTVGTPKIARAALSIGLVLAVDVLGLVRWGMLQDVRGYTVYKAAQQLYDMQLLTLEEGSTCAVAIVTLCARISVVHVLLPKQHRASHEEAENHALIVAASIVSEIVFIASVNMLLQDMMPAAASGFVHFLLVCVVAIITCTAQKVLADAVGRS